MQDIEAFIEASSSIDKHKELVHKLEDKYNKLNIDNPQKNHLQEQINSLKQIINIGTFALENRMKKFDVDQINEYVQNVQKYKNIAVSNGDRLFDIWTI